VLREVAREPRLTRTLAELLALTQAGALLRANAPAAVSDAFLATRLGGGWRHTYGVGFEHGSVGDIVARAAPPTI